MPVYHCSSCGFTFKRQRLPKACPFCQKEDVRPATKIEEKQFLIENGGQNKTTEKEK